MSFKNFSIAWVIEYCLQNAPISPSFSKGSACLEILCLTILVSSVLYYKDEE